MSDDMKFMREIWKSAHCVQDRVTVEPWMGGWRIVRDGEGLYWQWDKDTAYLMPMPANLACSVA